MSDEFDFVNGEPHVGDIGIVITTTCKKFEDWTLSILDVSAASVKKIWIKDPAGKVTEKDVAFATDGTDDKVAYVTAAEDLSVEGVYQFQIYVILPAGTFHSSIYKRRVRSNLK